MKKITVKVITISSQLLVVGLFLLLTFLSEGNNDNLVTISNSNFEKMADRISVLFNEERKMFDEVDDSVVVVLDDNTKEDILEEEEKNENVMEEVVSEEDSVVTEEVMEESSSNVSPLDNVIETYTGILTGYGPDCAGCGNFNTGKVSTASGYHVANIPDSEPIMTIVLDRGSTVGFENCRSASGCLTNFDLLFASESQAIGKTHNVKFELLRSGM